tara:strand:+ start:74 stop:265 length:192 start_codon:yes stop_codon:yes gene_type:complete
METECRLQNVVAKDSKDESDNEDDEEIVSYKLAEQLEFSEQRNSYCASQMLQSNDEWRPIAFA